MLYPILFLQLLLRNFHLLNVQIIYFIEEDIEYCRGYNICGTCCDINMDCACDQNCDTNNAPNGVCSIPRKIDYGKISNYH